MKRFNLTLSQRLFLTLVGTLLVLQVVSIYLDRLSMTSVERNRQYIGGPVLVGETARILHRFSEDQRPKIARGFSDPRGQFFASHEPELLAEDVRDPKLEADATRALRLAGFPVAELRIAAREYASFAAGTGPHRLHPKRPAMLRVGSQAKGRFAVNPEVIPGWVSGKPRPASVRHNSEFAKEPPPRAADGPPLPSPLPSPLRDGAETEVVEVFTYALRFEGERLWTTLYLLHRAPAWNLQYSKLIMSALAAVFVGGIAVMVGRSNILPLRDLAKGADQLSRGDRAPEVKVRGAKDVQEIVVAFNGMNARVSQATEYQIGLLRSIGHDLKGPLAAVGRLVSTTGPQDTRAQIEERLDIVHGIVESIVSFSRAVMRDGDVETTDLSEMLHMIIEEQADLGADATAETPGRVLIECRVNATQRCLRNLVENAIKYGGRARARLYVEGMEAVVQIDDDGPGISPEELETVFLPFQRLANDTQGSGLGLAIARTIAIDQGGSVVLKNRKTGGLRAELRLLARQKG